MTPEERANKVLHDAWLNTDLDDNDVVKYVADAIRQAIQEEREACAKVAEERVRLLQPAEQNEHWDQGFMSALKFCAKAIRDRK